MLRMFLIFLRKNYIVSLSQKTSNKFFKAQVLYHISLNIMQIPKETGVILTEMLFTIAYPQKIYTLKAIDLRNRFA